MNDIEKAEQRRAKGQGGEQEAARHQRLTDFKMDVTILVRKSLESHEFAIAPPPRFKAQSGMKALFEEGRKRHRHRDDEDDQGDVAPSRRSRADQEAIKKKNKALLSSGGDELEKSVGVGLSVMSPKAKKSCHFTILCFV